MREKKRRGHVLSWQSSGLSKAAYCRREGLVYATFCSWCREYESGQSGFILVSGDGLADSELKRAVVLLPNGIELTFPDGIDSRSLKELMDV